MGLAVSPDSVISGTDVCHCRSLPSTVGASTPGTGETTLPRFSAAMREAVRFRSAGTDGTSEASRTVLASRSSRRAGWSTGRASASSSLTRCSRSTAGRSFSDHSRRAAEYCRSRSGVSASLPCTTWS